MASCPYSAHPASPLVRPGSLRVPVRPNRLAEPRQRTQWRRSTPEPPRSSTLSVEHTPNWHTHNPQGPRQPPPGGRRLWCPRTGPASLTGPDIVTQLEAAAATGGGQDRGGVSSTAAISPDAS